VQTAKLVLFINPFLCGIPWHLLSIIFLVNIQTVEKYISVKTEFHNTTRLLEMSKNIFSGISCENFGESGCQLLVSDYYIRCRNDGYVISLEAHIY